MSSPVRFFSILALLSLAACGFAPMYGSSSKGAAAGLNQIDIAMIRDQSGVYLRNLLIDNFYQDGYPASPTHTLQVGPITEVITDLDITMQSEATRKQIRLHTAMTLTERASGEVVLNRPLSSVTSFNVLGSQFTTRVSESDAREAALAELARQIESQVALYLNR